MAPSVLAPRPGIAMEEAELLKERLQAITEKRKIQEVIAIKRREIDEKKFKLQYLKKKVLREQWLQDGLSVQCPEEAEARRLQAHNNQQQVKLLQITIHRMEQEIEAMDRQEMMISKNEGLILKRLKAVEKSAEDIIKEVKADVTQEPVQYSYSAIPDVPKSYNPSNLKKQKSPELQAKDQPKPTLFAAMEINVQKDLRTGESHVLSTAAITDREFQQRGVKVYDDGRKSIYALGSQGQVLPSGVDLLTAAEVEELLRKATERKSNVGLERQEPRFSSPHNGRKKAEPHRLQEPHQRPPLDPPRTPPELRHRQSGGEAWSHIPHSRSSRRDAANGQSYFSNGYETGWATSAQNGGQVPPYPEPRGDHRGALFSHSKHRETPTAHSANSRVTVLNAMPANLDSTEPVTMIFMGYQRADPLCEQGEEGTGYEGAIRAELVVIDDEDDCEAQETRQPVQGRVAGTPTPVTTQEQHSVQERNDPAARPDKQTA
ncbi:hypothetical protein AAFF_G00229140 [Aldrovandia affinis]|uniref:Palmdelphin n=1 Tax=Aldrovandia affinis TaxID=143900 RepID=A0AAD7WUH9_9TELE|nr:hypothetical protein AAFF_G00229140 [Aldrovandia affinis]